MSAAARVDASKKVSDDGLPHFSSLHCGQDTKHSGLYLGWWPPGSCGNHKAGHTVHCTGEQCKLSLECSFSPIMVALHSTRLSNVIKISPVNIKVLLLFASFSSGQSRQSWLICQNCGSSRPVYKSSLLLVHCKLHWWIALLPIFSLSFTHGLIRVLMEKQKGWKVHSSKVQSWEWCFDIQMCDASEKQNNPFSLNNRQSGKSSQK